MGRNERVEGEEVWRRRRVEGRVAALFSVFRDLFLGRNLQIVLPVALELET